MVLCDEIVGWHGATCATSVSEESLCLQMIREAGRTAFPGRRGHGPPAERGMAAGLFDRSATSWAEDENLLEQRASRGCVG
jgi:hypothetical protein